MGPVVRSISTLDRRSERAHTLRKNNNKGSKSGVWLLCAAFLYCSSVQSPTLSVHFVEINEAKLLRHHFSLEVKLKESSNSVIIFLQPNFNLYLIIHPPVKLETKEKNRGDSYEGTVALADQKMCPNEWHFFYSVIS